MKAILAKDFFAGFLDAVRAEGIVITGVEPKKTALGVIWEVTPEEARTLMLSLRDALSGKGGRDE